MTVPVSLVSAVKRGGTPLHLVHVAGGCYGRIRYRKVCEIEDREVADQDIGRGYETPAAIVPVTDADLDHLPLVTAHAIELLGTLPTEAIDPLRVGAASYYLAASTASAATVRPYVLLVQALARRSQVAIVKYAVRGDRERLHAPPPERHFDTQRSALERRGPPRGRRRPLPHRRGRRGGTGRRSRPH
ncbi:Ku protein [Streptomyces camelliae]|uniref:Ku domain-containing protein n=1 Tax=Streptomyces camelliae TaxID=3004093 RepID=A0ABY7PHE0_9ACTN|nr:Ku protein [Streptomyces sp. HUAS 2-6]WBO69047.1 hypothetical protein O1G22_42965 [Streptomyces sp. HUAS 2-6]